jgi:hypothetical protein
MLSLQDRRTARPRSSLRLDQIECILPEDSLYATNRMIPEKPSRIFRRRLYCPTVFRWEEHPDFTARRS